MSMLGDYAAEVLSAYAVSFVCLAAMIWRERAVARQARRELESAEADASAQGAEISGR